jgi:hypothetical protein
VQDAATAEIKALEAQAATDKQENTRLTARISERDAQLATAAADLKSQAAACAAAANEAAAKASADAKRFAAGISERDAQLATAAADLKSQAAACAAAANEAAAKASADAKRFAAGISERDEQLATAAADLKSQAAACAAAANEAAAKASADAKRFAAGISERDEQLATAAADLKSQTAALANTAKALAAATQTNDYLTALIACQDEPLQECSCDGSGENDCDAALGQCCIALGVSKQLDEVCPACTDDFRWFKFEVTSIRGGADDRNSGICGLAGCVQYSKLNLYGTTGAPLLLDGATNPGGSSPGAEGPKNAIDNLASSWILPSLARRPQLHPR